MELTHLPAAAQTCFNRLTYGGTAEKLFLPEEDPADYLQLLRDNFHDYRPATAEHAGLVCDLTLARWILCRRQRANARAEYETTSRCVPESWSSYDLHGLELQDRYKTRAERTLQRAHSAVRAVKKDDESSQSWKQQWQHAEQRIQMQVERHQSATSSKARRAVIEEAKVQQVQRTEQARLANEAFEKKIKMSQEPVQVDEHGAYIEQRLYISNEDGEAVIDQVSPPNPEIRSRIAQRKHYPVKPTAVVRHFIFNGKIPSGYEFVMPNEEMRRHCPKLEINVPMTFAEWRQAADQEDDHDLHPAVAEEDLSEPQS